MSHDPQIVDFATAVTQSVGGVAEGRADATTDRILRAGVMELLEFGLQRTSMANVAKRAGVARMTVYRRYPSKEALARAVMAREVGRLMQSIDANVDPALPFEARWVEGFARTVHTVRRHRLLRRLLLSDPERTVVALTLSASPLLQLARAPLATFMQTNLRGVGRREAEWAAESALRLLQSLALTPSDALDVDDLDALRGYAECQVRALLPKPAVPQPRA